MRTATRSPDAEQGGHGTIRSAGCARRAMVTAGGPASYCIGPPGFSSRLTQSSALSAPALVPAALDGRCYIEHVKSTLRRCHGITRTAHDTHAHQRLRNSPTPSTAASASSNRRAPMVIRASQVRHLLPGPPSQRRLPPDLVPATPVGPTRGPARPADRAKADREAMRSTNGAYPGRYRAYVRWCLMRWAGHEVDPDATPSADRV